MRLFVCRVSAMTKTCESWKCQSYVGRLVVAAMGLVQDNDTFQCLCLCVGRNAHECLRIHTHNLILMPRPFDGPPLLTPEIDLEGIVDTLVETKYPSDFAWSPVVNASFYADLVYEGFLPIAARRGARAILLPKLHRERCCMKPQDIHLSKNAKKRSQKFDMSIDLAFEQAIEGCVRQHGENWLLPPLQAEFIKLHGDDSIHPNVHIHSIEVWQDDTLVAGEIGCSVGASYTSLTGFYDVSSSGSIQLMCLAKILQKQDFELWDLGMCLPYKFDMGAESYSREDFVGWLRKVRDKNRKLQLPDRVNCRKILTDSF